MGTNSSKARGSNVANSLCSATSANRLCDLADAGKLQQLQASLTPSNCNQQESSWFRRTPLLAAASSSSSSSNSAAIVQLLLATNASTQAADRYSQSALHRAAGTGSVATVQLLAAAGADVDAVARCQFTPLMTAALHNRAAAVAVLLQAGACVTAVNCRGRTARQVAELEGCWEAAGVLAAAEQIDASRTVEQKRSEAARHLQRWKIRWKLQQLDLLQLVRSGNVNELKLAVHKDNCNLAFGGITPLMAAAQTRDNAGAACAQLLLSRGADARLVGTGGNSPLHCAAESNSGEVLQLLVDAGADVNAVNDRGDTPLMKAAASDSTEAAKVLVSHRAEIFAQNADGLTAMDLAEAAGSGGVLLLLHQPLRFKTWKKVQFLGSGSFRESHTVRTDTGLLLAAKTIWVTLNSGNSAVAEAVAARVSEAQILCSLRHRNILRFVKVERCRSGQVCMLTELIQGRSLSRIVSKQPLAERQMRNYCSQMCDALQYLHSQNPHVIHRDIKGSNVMVLPNGIVKLIDFGLAMQLLLATESAAAASECDSDCCNCNFMSPEVIAAKRPEFSPHSDIWALGCVIYQMATGRVPHSQLTDWSQLAVRIHRYGAPRLPGSCSAALQDFYGCCVATEPKLRWLATDLLRHEFLHRDFA